MRANGRDSSANPLSLAMASLRTAFFGVGLLSFAINLLMLTGPLFMVQVYDRVLTSRSVPTLVALFALVCSLYLFLAALEFLRTRTLSRAGYWVDQRLGGLSFRTWICQGVVVPNDPGRPIGDLATLRTFLGSPGLLGVFDLPWVPVYLAIVFLIHPSLGLLAIGGAALVVLLAGSTEMLTREPFGRSMVMEAVESRFAEQTRRNAEVILPMGMLANVEHQWQAIHGEALERAQAGGERAEVFAAASKSLRLLLQSAILALGAWLAIEQDISPGMIVAASIIAGRALAPVDQVIGQWRSILRAREARRRLAAHLDRAERGELRFQLPEPKGQLQVRIGTAFAPGSPEIIDGARNAILSQVFFDLEPGDGLGVIGPSASGKSTLARLLVGAWQPALGTIRLDGASLDQWDSEALGRFIGYLPQSVELLAGTVRNNIARFHVSADDSEVYTAARLAGVHDMILRLPDGYDTRIGFGGMPLSGGQVQRIGLARALFRQPRLVVLDEPNSNLDADGDAALTAAIEQMRASGAVVIVMAHRPSAIAAVNKVLMLSNGSVVDFGEKHDVLRKVTRMATV